MAIKIRFVTGNDVISMLVLKGERDGWATHVEAVLPDGSLLGAHLQGGVAIRPAGYDKDVTTRELIVEIPVPQAEEQIFYDFLHSQVGKPYDLTGVIGLAVGRNWREPDSWFCSELIAAGLEHAKVFNTLSSSFDHISPRDALLMLSCMMPIAA